MKNRLLLLICLASCLTLSAQDLNNIPPPLCGLGPGGEKYHVIQRGPGIFRGKLFSKLEQIPVGKEHDWFLYLEDTEGRPVEFAKIAADGANYDAARGFATPPTVSHHIGNGHYLVEHVKYSVPGTWTMIFQVIRNEQAEILSFEVEVVPGSEAKSP